MNDARLLRVKVNVDKIDKTALFEGKKGRYLDLTIWLREEPGEYGDHGPVYQDLGKERRMAGEKGAILGNATWVDGGAAPQRTTVHADVGEYGEDVDDIPF